MKQQLTKTLSLTAAALLTAASADAAVIAATDFNTATKPGTGDTMTGIVWTGDDLVNVTPSTSASYALLDGDAGFTPKGFQKDAGEFGATAFAPKINIQNEADWAATFTFDLNNGYFGTVTEISFDYQALTNAGANQSSGRAVPIFVTVNGNAFDVTKSTSSGSSSGTLTFAGSENLTTGTNTVTISTDLYTDSLGWNLGIDDLEISGDIEVPEPGSLALLGLGGLLIGARRRRA